MKTTAKKMSVFQLTTLVAANMLGADYYVAYELSCCRNYFDSILARYCTQGPQSQPIFAQAGMFTKPGGMGGYSEYKFGRTGHFMANYAYSISLVIANVAIAVSAVGYGAVLFGLDLNPWQVSEITVVLFCGLRLSLISKETVSQVV